MPHNYLNWLRLSIAVNVMFAMFFIGKRIYYSNYTYFHPGETIAHRWMVILNSKRDPEEVLFLGTSITYGFPFKKEFGNAHIKNLGFSGSISDNVLTNVQKIIVRKPKSIFLEFGVNDFKRHISVDSVLNNLHKIISIMKLQSPGTLIYVQSVLPTSNNQLNYKIMAYNSKVLAESGLSRYTFIDLYPKFLRYDKIDPDLSDDGTHLNDTGYFLWHRLIEQYVQ
jgi:lysophospholipase L1-like esterase